MPLSQRSLSAGLSSAFDQINSLQGVPVPTISVPLMDPRIAKILAGAYDSWVVDSVPLAGGVLTVVTPGLPSTIAAALVLTPNFAGWTPGLIAYWSTVTWGNNPLFSLVNPTIAAGISGLSSPMAAYFAAPTASSQADAADRIADLLYTYTVTVQVTATTIAGVVSAVPVL